MQLRLLILKECTKQILTTRFPMTTVARKKGTHEKSPTSIQSHILSIHSPHNTRNTIINEWKKSVKFHLGSCPSGLSGNFVTFSENKLKTIRKINYDWEMSSSLRWQLYSQRRYKSLEIKSCSSKIYIWCTRGDGTDKETKLAYQHCFTATAFEHVIHGSRTVIYDTNLCNSCRRVAFPWRQRWKWWCTVRRSGYPERPQSYPWWIWAGWEWATTWLIWTREAMKSALLVWYSRREGII